MRRANGRGSISKYKNRFRWQLRNEVGETLASGIVDTRKGGEAAIVLASAQRIQGTLASPDQITLAEYAEQWLQHLDIRAVSKMKYRQELSHILPILGRKRLKDIKPADIKNALYRIANTHATRTHGKTTITIDKFISSRTVSKARTHLRSIFKEAVRDQIIYVSPADAVKPVKKSKPENPHRALDFNEVAKLHEIGTILYEAGECRLWIAIFTALSIGLRKSEVMGLRWEDVDLERGVLHIQHTAVSAGNQVFRGKNTKTDHSNRQILMPPSLIAALRIQRQKWELELKDAEDAWVETGAVFATKTGEWTHPDKLSKALRELPKFSDPAYYYHIDSRGISRGHRIFEAKYRARLEAIIAEGAPLQPLSPHDLRHTAGTLMLRRGMPIEVVSKMLGHADISITYKIYRHVLESEKRQHIVDLFPEPIAARAVDTPPLN